MIEEIAKWHGTLSYMPTFLTTTAAALDLVYLFKRQTILFRLAGWVTILVATLFVSSIISGVALGNEPAVNPSAPLIHLFLSFLAAFFAIAYAGFRGYFLLKGKAFSYYIFFALSFLNVLLAHVAYGSGEWLAKQEKIKPS